MEKVSARDYPSRGPVEQDLMPTDGYVPKTGEPWVFLIFFFIILVTHLIRINEQESFIIFLICLF